jgi:chromosome segregation ATPase
LITKKPCIFNIMYLKSIELSGFKSFAKKSVLEFNSPISAIVGPNGSGKSNIAESFRFVLGEQSIKSMRGKRGEDLIFNGTPEVPRANRASVKVTFDNSTKFLNIDFPEVTLERVVHRDGVNEYFINGSAVRLKDIVELLAGAHVGSSGHHIISQGEADRILNASPKERRAMVEDALGLKIYQYKKQESERKLEKTEVNIEQVESLRREIAPHIRFLKKQVEKAEKVAEMRERLKTLYKEYLYREEVHLKNSRSHVDSLSAPIRERIARLEAELSAARTTLETSKAPDEKSTKILNLQSQMKDFRTQRDGMVRDLGRIEGELAAARRLLERQRQTAEADDTAKVYLRDVKMIGESVQAKIREVFETSDVSRMKEAFRWIENAFATFIAEKSEVQADAEAVLDIEQDIAQLETDRAALDKDIHDIKNQEQIVSLEYELLKMEIDKEKDSSRDAEKQVFRIQAEQNEAISELNSLKGEDDKLRLEEEDFKRELQEAGVLIGRDVLSYPEYRPLRDDGSEAAHEEIAAEPRNLQEDRRRELQRIKIRLEDAGIAGLDETMKEYAEATERDQFLERELSDLAASAESLRGLIAELEDRMNVEFRDGVAKINRQFGEYFALMFGGGTASLRVVKEERRRRISPDADTDLNSVLSDDGEMPEPLDEIEEGIEVEVNLPRKKIRGLMMLSGGERALTSIALLFAVSQVNPPPFIILDETDAALDEANSKKYGDMVKNLSDKSQLIVITHNRETMSRAGILYGVTMGRGGVSALLSIKFEEAVAVAK